MTEFEIKQLGIKFSDEIQYTLIDCIGSFEEDINSKIIEKKRRGVVSKQIVRGDGTGTLLISIHCPYSVYVKAYGMKLDNLINGVYAYGIRSKHAHFSVTASIFDEDGNQKLKAYPNCVIENGVSRKIENGAEEVVEINLEIAVSPDSYKNGMYEAPVSMLSNSDLANNWMTTFMPEDVVNGEIEVFDNPYDLILDMGIGWNYGNVYDAFDYNVGVKTPVTYIGKQTVSTNIQEIRSYNKTWQAYCIMYTDGTTAWESSEFVYENTDEMIIISHDVNSSVQTGNMKTLGIQLINHEINTNKTFSVNIVVKYNDVEIYNANSDLNLVNDVTQYVNIDISSFNSTPKGVFLVTVTFLSRPDLIVKYEDPMDINDNESYLQWGNTKLNSVVIDMIKQVGYKTVRLPVTWANHTDHDGHIDDEWMNEIKRAVNIIIDAGLYCILNIHHDTGQMGWLIADYDQLDIMKAKLKGLWQQIATEFANYNEHLIFEGFNEILDSIHISEQKWTNPDASCYVAVQELNQTFIDTVRACGGKNTTRWLIANAYATNHDYYDDCDMVGSYLMPYDSKNKTLVQFHIYKSLEESKTILNRIYERFRNDNIGIIIGEWGLEASAASTTEREVYAYGFASYCKSLNIHCAWWDDGGSNLEDPASVYNFGLIGKGIANVWWYKNIAEQMISGWNSGDSNSDAT